jgi:hypothetical protein
MASAPDLRRQVGALLAIGLLAAALAAAEVVGGSEPLAGVPQAGVTAADYERIALAGDDLEPTGARIAGSAKGAKGAKEQKPDLDLSYYVGVDFQEVEPGGAQLFEIRCPTRGEQPLAGGTFAPVAGLVSVSSSRMNPSPDFPTRPRAWYEAVVNIMSTPLRWKPFVTCANAKGIIP